LLSFPIAPIGIEVARLAERLAPWRAARVSAPVHGDTPRQIAARRIAERQEAGAAASAPATGAVHGLGAMDMVLPPSRFYGNTCSAPFMPEPLAPSARAIR
jgi:hypothetical protein